MQYNFTASEMSLDIVIKEIDLLVGNRTSAARILGKCNTGCAAAGNQVCLLRRSV
jgi:hypothetical protein